MTNNLVCLVPNGCHIIEPVVLVDVEVVAPRAGRSATMSGGENKVGMDDRTPAMLVPNVNQPAPCISSGVRTAYDPVK